MVILPGKAKRKNNAMEGATVEQMEWIYYLLRYLDLI